MLRTFSSTIASASTSAPVRCRPAVSVSTSFRTPLSLTRCFSCTSTSTSSTSTSRSALSSSSFYSSSSLCHRFFSSDASTENKTPEKSSSTSVDMDQLLKDFQKMTANSNKSTTVTDAAADAEMVKDATVAEDDVSAEEKFAEKSAPAAAVPESKETKKGPTHVHSFQTETKQILNIMAKSLYTEKEVFLRELISNASDALEKLRYLQSSASELLAPVEGAEIPLEIRVWADAAKNQLIIQDSGIGMTASELIDHLGTIAKSGSKNFVNELLKTQKSGDSSAMSSIIGQFGVGFYSSFMVADRIDVYSKSAKKEANGIAHFWTSTGDGSYEISEAENVQRGTKIILHLKEECKEFIGSHILEGIVRKYSNFVSFPIFLHNERLNNVGAIWLKDPKTVSDEDYQYFYQNFCNAYDKPIYRYHFRTDVPININAILYFPERHMEKFGMGQQEPGINLYSRRVLIQAKCKALLPQWARFVKGIVDSEDLPLNISRETMQDSRLLQKINAALVRKIIRYLEDQAKENLDKYLAWFSEFGVFLKEGVCADWQNKNELARLLRFESSQDEKKLISLDEYIGRMKANQKAVYFLIAPSRKFALSSPYYEAMKAKGIEVLFLTNTMDEFVMKQLDEYQRRKLVSADSSEAAKEFEDEKKSSDDSEIKGEVLSNLLSFLNKALADRASSIKVTTRPIAAPAILVDHESASVRRMMKHLNMGPNLGENTKQKMEINPKHALIAQLAHLAQPAQQRSNTNRQLATVIAEQIFDNALIASDLLDNPRTILGRINQLMELALKNAEKVEETKQEKIEENVKNATTGVEETVEGKKVEATA